MTIYFSDFKRSLVDKLQKVGAGCCCYVGQDVKQAALGCVGVMLGQLQPSQLQWQVHPKLVAAEAIAICFVASMALNLPQESEVHTW